jgi:hypothetical protein
MSRLDDQDNLLHYMPILVRSSIVTEWERDFCVSMVHRSKKGPFIASEKQMTIMARIVDKFQRATMAEDLDARGNVVE